MLGGGEPGHVRAGLRDDDVGVDRSDAGDGADQVPESTKRFDHHPGGDVADRRGVPVGQVQVDAGQEHVVLGEPSGQRLGQRRDLRAELSLGQVRQRGRVVPR